jgi:hypothetical protein
MMLQIQLICINYYVVRLFSVYLVAWEVACVTFRNEVEGLGFWFLPNANIFIGNSFPYDP